MAELKPMRHFFLKKKKKTDSGGVSSGGGGLYEEVSVLHDGDPSDTIAFSPSL